ncbi:MCE family protein [Mycolicibacillus parakoreensis]|uniref:MlaD family protein n=1 Tax=Mycolicibacillus parakoreensis TaxID=1069221 RepID=A0ABY3TYK1_9MYCO|nr:MlaD family protein [Mycolicibacillus parakoreensis]MCV7316535.1 MCE family protein [Mycolicibacillus parakoreensis]ULN52760.1 MlaD family protein [Mycolicibacillus parakoreensis]HLR98358.1 MlaD family protein [Mycolicibacillus parakoreensis]
MRGPGGQAALGAIALALVAVAVATAALVYVRPPGQTAVVFYTDDAAAVHPGDPVRIAGVTVGRIKDLAIEPERVRVRAAVAADAFVGDRSQVEVRMRTVVGGHYTAITSLGEKPLGDTPIPAERVRMPYNLIRTVSDATTVTGRLAPAPIRAVLDKLQRGLAGDNVEAVSALLEAGSGLAGAVETQRGQLSTILDISDEYLEALSGYTAELTRLLRKVAVIEQTLVLYSAGFGQALAGMGDLLESLGVVGEFYAGHRDKFVEKVRNWQAIVQTWADRNGLVVRGLRRVRNKIERVLDAQNAAPLLLATDLCIPVPGQPC